MTVTVFDGTDDSVQCALGGCNQTGAVTLACVFKRAVNGVVHALVVNHDSGGTARAGMEIRAAVAPTNAMTYSIGGTGAFSTTTVLAADGWCVIVMTKTAGTTTPRYHFKKEAAAGWVHENADKTLGNPTTQASGTVRFGEWAGIDDANGRMAIAAEWTVALTDLQCEELAAEAGWLGNTGGAPAGLWKFDSATLTDLTGGGADETVRTGTTLVSGDDPPFFWPPAGLENAPETLRVVQSPARLA